MSSVQTNVNGFVQDCNISITNAFAWRYCSDTKSFMYASQPDSTVVVRDDLKIWVSDYVGSSVDKTTQNQYVWFLVVQ